MKKILKVPFNKLLNDKNLAETYLKYLINTFYDYNEIEYNNLYLSLSSFYPLPTKFVVEDYKDDHLIVEEHDNILVFKGKENISRLVFANRNLPNNIVHPIPFTFPIINKNNKMEIFHSNIFYYEITILEQYRTPWDNQTLVIGFGNIDTNFNSNPGWKNDTFGYHLDDGSFQKNGICYKKFGPICKEGDTVGAGLIFIKTNFYKVFFTYNGYLISDSEIFEIKYDITTILGFDYSHKIKYNFGKYKFNFNLYEIINSNKIISNYNVLYNKFQKTDYIDNYNKIKNKQKSSITNYSFNNINNIFQTIQFIQQGQDSVDLILFNNLNNII